MKTKNFDEYSCANYTDNEWQKITNFAIIGYYSHKTKEHAMNVSLTPELERFIQNKVSSGLYTSASEVVRESLRLMTTYDDVQKQRINQLNAAIDIGLNQLDEGQRINAKEAYERQKTKIKNIKQKKD